ncbi:SDR family oxidoreductase [Devosia sp. 63-57]|mgnify:CR=1 FL=1|uniref:SDR family oxidoreductase n=1 Tax=Devosia sp. 63-57 TaxID=1895751 RepID=UPI00086C08B6|nr:SDR family oxidoreductase [Devosia sp. 63-57]ODT47218.1 MAG: short-chain dehydrogenase [Pelagibacterium sp. SCN 63-126]ODU89034.1 MAG: short-chain dehydrogenase [Pelagibacterium sp. SCN 63-17]OJX43071.1 MAG: short-chain dehydrogenase [Devosia sp. 63-57]
MSEFEGKVAIVTGGAASIGLDITKGLVEAGVKVVVGARSREAGDAVARQFGDKVRYVAADIRKDEDLDALVAAAAEWGRLDIVVNNAAVYDDNGAQSSRESWLNTLNTNVVSSALLSEKARPHLAKQGGSIVNISSISAYAAQSGRWTYPVSKAAILHLTHSQALDYAKDGIRSNSIILGWTWSDPIAGLSGNDQEKADSVGANFHILGRVGRGPEAAAAVLFLSSKAASFTTGSELKVDGGYTALGPEGPGQAIALLTGGSASVR